MLIGHEKIWADLKSRAGSGALHHAQLFLGPEHVGKTHTALLLASALQGAEEHVILKKQIFEGLSSDTLLFLDDGENLPIETVRTVVERASQTHTLPYLIFIIENLGRMKPEAVNALLKTIEEPNEGIIFLLTAHQEEDVLPTLRSRCHVTHFQTVTDEKLRTLCAENVFAEQLLFFAMGRPGKLRRLMDNAEYFEAHQNMLQDLVRFLENPKTPAAFELIRKYEAGPLLPEMLDILLARARTLALAFQVEPAAVDRIERSKQDLKANVNRKLVLENLLLPFVP